MVTDPAEAARNSSEHKLGDKLRTEKGFLLTSTTHHNLWPDAFFFSIHKGKRGSLPVNTFQTLGQRYLFSLITYLHSDAAEIGGIRDRKCLLTITGSVCYTLPCSPGICSIRSPLHTEQACSFSFPQWKLWE